jgi:hypothetical protein
MPIIHVSYGEGSFTTSDLINHIQSNLRSEFIIQGQQACSYDDHSKPKSLDYWVRDKSTLRDTKQATNDLVQTLVRTGQFEEGVFLCPDSGRKCKGIKMVT